MDIALLILRLVVGGLFIGHGAQKLFGAFGGYGIEGTGGFLASLGYPKGRGMARLTGITEFGAGCLLVLGLLTPIAAAGIIGVMVNAIVSVHAENGMWNDRGGSEYPLVLMTVAAALAFAGPGAYGIDTAADLELAGVAWGLSAILLGVLAATVVALSRRPIPEAQAEAQERKDTRAA